MSRHANFPPYRKILATSLAGKDSYQGLDSNLRNYLYQKRKEVFVVNFIESDIFLVVLRLGVVVPTVTFCNYCQN